MEDEIKFIPDEDMQFSVSDIVALSQTRNWGLDVCLIDEMWKVSKGAGVKVAVLDTGISNHTDLVGAWTIAFNCSSDDSFEDRKSGHGTHVAGIIGARDNDFGVVGVAPEVTLFPIKVLSDTGGGSFQAIEAGIRKAKELGANIISMSLGSPVPPPESLHDAIKEAAGAGIIMLAAAGNDSGNVNYPARYDEVIAIAALDQNGDLAKFSSRDNTVDAVGPGVDIYSTFLNNQYAKMSGTSQACPFLAGVCALIYSYRRDTPGAQPISNYIDMMKALEEVCDSQKYISTGHVQPSDTGNWGFGVPTFANIDWNKV